MSFAEFYVSPSSGNADNRNGGSDTGAATVSTNGAYTQGGGAGGGTSDRFTAASGTPFSDRAVGDYAAIMNDGTTGTTPFIGRVTAVNGGGASIDIDSAKFSGTRPTTAASGITARVGGPWIGPTGSTGYPFNFIAATAKDGSGNTPRVNGVGTSNVTAAMTHGLTGPVRFEGMTASPGDGGRWTIDGGASGVSYILLTVTQPIVHLKNLTVQNNGASGGASGLSLGSTNHTIEGVVVNSVRGTGLLLNGSAQTYIECEAYACNQSNGANNGGFGGPGTGALIRCVSHDNTGANSSGYAPSAEITCVGCVADSNGSSGWNLNNSDARLVGCDAYNNGGDGVAVANTATRHFYFENCNFAKNGGYGVNGTGSGARSGAVVSCGFGSGTQANTSGTTNSLKGIVESGSVTYASGVTPWTDPANGDFRINLAAAKGAGRGAFTQTQGGYAGTISYPDIGAGQHIDSGGSSGGTRIFGVSGARTFRWF